MKVAHIINSLSIGGAEKLAIDSLPYYINGLNHIDLIVLKKTKTNFESLLPVGVNPIYLTDKSLYSPLLIFKLIPILRKYDIVHIHLFPALYWVVLANFFSLGKTKLAYTEHSTHNKRRNNFVFKIFDKFIYSKLNFIGCISQATEENLVHHLKSQKLNTSVIFNGIDLSKFESVHGADLLYNYFDKESFVLIQVSSFRAQKDQKTVIQSLQYLPDSIKLLLVGDGELKSSNEELVEELNLNNRVKFLGNRNDIPQLMSYADVCVLSSHYEGFGLAVLEGMISKKPSIASDVEGIREVVKGYGLLFERGNAKELANLVLQLYSNEIYYNEIANNCYNRALEFDIRDMVKQYIDKYEKMV